MKINTRYLAIFAGAALFFAACTDSKNKPAGQASAGTAETAGLKIAYVNVDSLEAHYELLKTRREEFKKRQEVMEAELQQSYQQMQAKGEEMQRKAQSMTQTELQQ
ncbi:MAG: OmpH family outer membrane protein, partial [Chitinophagia bacterium]|nr:OmpH family outer membrane protein [Chitinophagia bacterium]